MKRLSMRGCSTTSIIVFTTQGYGVGETDKSKEADSG
jgi:hypothetical protein